MKKVGIITYHFPLNAGAVLQCVALQKKLEKIGCDVKIIDYRPAYHTEVYKPIRNPFMNAYSFAKRFTDKSLAYQAYRYMRNFYSVLDSNSRFFITSKRQKKFESFISRHMKLTERYETLEKLQAKPPDCDLYVCGSDQIWNSNITNYLPDMAYYLDFGHDDVKRVSYAASADIKDSEVPSIIPKLQKFDRISVREYETKCQLEELLNREVLMTLDPTLLLIQEDYSMFEDEVNASGHYVLFYGLKTADSEVLLKTLKAVQEKYRLDIVDISPIKWGIQGRTAHAIGPGEFLSYIKHASVVVTNSFHGTVFSILYRNNFWSVLPSLKGSRIENLLSVLSLKNRIIQSINEVEDKDLTSVIEYSNVERELEVLREVSVNYLLRNI